MNAHDPKRRQLVRAAGIAGAGLVASALAPAMAEEFEKKEHLLFGADRFEKTARRVAGLEQAMGIHELGQFTPTPS
jgi:hypothetical protein